MPTAEGRFNSYSDYLLRKYGSRTYRVSVDAGFSCPNRGGVRGNPGCSFCDVTGSRSPYLGTSDSLREQIRSGTAFLEKRYKAKNFLLYFQAYSNTNAEAGILKAIYDHALALADFKELIVSTRPDCVDEEKADLLASFRTASRDVWTELGLQSARPETLVRIRRGHGVEAYERAVGLLRSRGIKTAVHLIFGLPGEGEREILETVKFVTDRGLDGIKIHNLHIPYGAPLAEEFYDGELTLPCDVRHLDYVVKALELLPPETVVMRITCDTPKERLAFPRRFTEKHAFLKALEAELQRRDTRQGVLYRARTT